MAAIVHFNEPDPYFTEIAGKRCFVIMPFGQKDEIDFDRVYQEIVKPVTDRLRLECVRSDEVSKAGMIQQEMIERLIDSDAVFLDVTRLNANVFYALGVRHTVRRSGTILMRMKDVATPFNSSGMRALDYSLDATEDAQAAVEANLKNSLMERNIDSLVHALVPGLRVSKRAAPILKTERMDFTAPGLHDKRMGIVAGDLINVDFVDVWINPENTKMQMGRWHDDSISANIRYFGATRDNRGYVVRDAIANELRHRMGSGSVVEAGTVIATRPGELARTNRVKAILHVAGQHGEPGKGYLPIRNYATCVTQALKEIDRINANFRLRWRYGGPLKSVIFPLFGTRSPDRDPQDVADKLILTAKTFFDMRVDTSLERIYFLAYTDSDLELCRRAFARLGLSRDK